MTGARPLLLLLACCGTLVAKEPIRISIAESPVAGLRERVETHLAREYDCIVISRSRPAAAALEQSIAQMKALHDAAQPPDQLLAADACAWVNSWDEFLRINRQAPADGVRELSFSVTDLQGSDTNAAALQLEKVPVRSNYEHTLAVRVAKALHLKRAAPESEFGSADKAVTLAVLPLARNEERSLYFTKNPSDTLYLGMEAVLQECLPRGAAVLSRDRIQAILAEHRLAGITGGDGAGLRSVAHLLPAQALVCGTVARRLANPAELRLDLHLIEPRSGMLLTAWEGRCPDAAGLVDLASTGLKALMAAPWKAPAAVGSATARRLREAQFMVAHDCTSAAWELARDRPELYDSLLRGLLRQAGEYCIWMKPVPENPDSFRNRMLMETAVMLDDLLKGRAASAPAGHDGSAVPCPDLIRAETRYWMGEYAEAERFCRVHSAQHPDLMRARAELILAWSLFKQQRLEESRALLASVEQQKGLMWGWPGLGGAYGRYWANDLNLALAERGGALPDTYRRIKEKMVQKRPCMNSEMALYLQEVERQEGTAGAVRDLSSLLVYNSAGQYDGKLLALKQTALFAQCDFSYLAPAYAVRGQCYEKLGRNQDALDDYALFLKIARHYGYHPQRVVAGGVPRSYELSYAACACDAAKRLEAEGFRPMDAWKSLAQTRPFPQDAAVYVLPVGTCDRTTLDRLCHTLADFIGGRVRVLKPAAVKDVIVQRSETGTPEYDGQALVESVLRQAEVPGDAVQLVLATSEVFRIQGGPGNCVSGSYDGGNTLLLSLRDPQMRDIVLLALHYRYTPRTDRGWQMDVPSVQWLFRNTHYCMAPCIFAGAPKLMSGQVHGICPRCQDAYKMVDFDALNAQTLAALKRQGAKIVPASKE